MILRKVRNLGFNAALSRSKASSKHVRLVPVSDAGERRILPPHDAATRSPERAPDAP
jgi:hypothetical protein